jgi:hypothetical protein
VDCREIGLLRLGTAPTAQVCSVSVDDAAQKSDFLLIRVPGMEVHVPIAVALTLAKV